MQTRPQLACFAFDLITLYIHLDGRYEDEELTFLEQHIFPQLASRRLCLDIGANIGNHAVAFAPHFERVIAFEPHPRTFALLSLNAGLADNITALNFGASDAAATIRVAQDPLNIAATSVGSALRPGAQIAFDLRRLDDVAEVTGAGEIGFVKIDVEGHEREALAGAAGLLSRDGPVIAMEVLKSDVADGATPAMNLLRDLGYRHFYELRPGGRFGILPRPIYKLGRALVSLVTGRRPAKALRMREITRLEPRSYLMLICAKSPLRIP
ncbi:FkbM family methyltransferase [Albidovulum sp.]